MKSPILLITLALLSTLLPLHAAIVIFQFQDNFGRPATPAVSLTPVSVPLIQSNTIVLSGLTTFHWPSNQTSFGSNMSGLFWGWTNGQLVLPLSAGGYTVQVSTWPRSWTLTVPDSTNTFYATDLSSNTLILGPQTVINNYAAGVLTNAFATNAPGVAIVNGIIVISTNYDALGAAAAVQTAIQSQFNALTNGFVDRSVTNTALNRLAQNDGSTLTGLNAGQVSGLGNLAIASSNTATVFGATNALFTSTATNAPNGTPLNAMINTNSANNLFQDTNALYFANAIGISDAQTRADLVGMMNEIQSSTISNNVVALYSFLPRFNPSGSTNNIFTIVGHYPIAFSNYNCNRYGLVLSNSQTLVYNLPDCRTNTQIFVWTSPQIDGNVPLAFFGGLANPAADEMLALTVNGNSANGYRIRSGASENASTGNGEQASWLLQYEEGSWAWPRVEARFAAGNFIFDSLCYDGKSLSAYEDFCQEKIDYNNPTFQTNYALAGITLNAPLTNLIIGANGYTNISTLKDAESVCAGFMVLNTPMTNILQWKAAYRTLMWMFPDQNYYFTLGDSTMAFGGNFQPNNNTATNSPWVAFKNSNQFSNALLTQSYAIGADAIEHYFTWGQDGNLSTNNLFKFDSGFIPAGKFKKRECFFKMGLNDIFGLTSYTNQIASAYLAFANICASNNILFDAFTLPNCFSNSGYGSAVAPYGDALRLWMNNFIISNAYHFNRVIRADLLISPHTMDTNPSTGPGFSQATDGGIHLGGVNGWIKNDQIADLMLGIAQPIQSDPTILNPVGSPFLWTNIYPAAVTFTWSGGTISAITNTVTLTSTSGETVVPPGNVVSVVYTGSPILSWYYTPGMIIP